MTTKVVDLQSEPDVRGPWSAIVCVNYVQRSLWTPLLAALGPGGVAIWIHPTRINLQRHGKPSSRFLLEPGEGPALWAESSPEIEVVSHDESWVGEAPQHLMRLVGRRRG